MPYGGQFAIDSMATGRIEAPDVQWADWDQRNLLLMATRDGRLQAHNMRRWPESLEWDIDLNPLEWQDVKSPDWARHW